MTASIQTAAPDVPAGITCGVYVRLSATEAAAVRRAKAQKNAEAAEAELLKKVRAHLGDCLDFADEKGYHVPADLQFVEANLTASIRGTKALPERDRMLAWLGTCKDRCTCCRRRRRGFSATSGGRKNWSRRPSSIRQHPDAHLHILTVTGKDYDLTTADGLATFNGDMSASQAEADRSSERRRRQTHRRARAGYYSGGGRSAATRSPTATTTESTPKTRRKTGRWSTWSSARVRPTRSRPPARG